jgi:transcriptional regulator with XRE-family HTH domain
MREALKIAIVRSGRTQRQIARECGIAENRLSAIVRGWFAPRPDEQERIAQALNGTVAELF